MVDKAIKDLEEKTDSINAFDFLGLDDTNINKSQKFSLNNLGTQIGQANKVIDSDTVKVEEEITSDLGSVQKLVVQKQGIISNQYEWDISSSTNFDLSTLATNDGTNNFLITVIASSTIPAGDLQITLPSLDYTCKILFDFTTIDFTSVKTVLAESEGITQTFLLLSNDINNIHKVFNKIKFNNREFLNYSDAFGVKGYLPIGRSSSTINGKFDLPVVGLTKKMQIVPINQNGVNALRFSTSGSFRLTLDGGAAFDYLIDFFSTQPNNVVKVSNWFFYVTAVSTTTVSAMYLSGTGYKEGTSTFFSDIGHFTKNFSVSSTYGVNFNLLEGGNAIANSTGVLFIDRGIDF